MEIVLYLFLGLVLFIIYVVIAKAIFEKYRASSGIEAFFWFMLFFLTLSFIFMELLFGEHIG